MISRHDSSPLKSDSLLHILQQPGIGAPGRTPKPRRSFFSSVRVPGHIWQITRKDRASIIKYDLQITEEFKNSLT